MQTATVTGRLRCWGRRECAAADLCKTRRWSLERGGPVGRRGGILRAWIVRTSEGAHPQGEQEPHLGGVDVDGGVARAGAGEDVARRVTNAA